MNDTERSDANDADGSDVSESSYEEYLEREYGPFEGKRSSMAPEEETPRSALGVPANIYLRSIAAWLIGLFIAFMYWSRADWAVSHLASGYDILFKAIVICIIAAFAAAVILGALSGERIEVSISKAILIVVVSIFSLYVFFSLFSSFF